MGLQNHVTLTCHGLHIKLPLGSTDLGHKRELLSLPDALKGKLSQNSKATALLLSIKKL